MLKPVGKTMSRPAMIKLGFTCVLLVPFAASLPSFSWSTVPTYIHFANQSGAFDDDAVKQLARQPFVVFEKDQGRWPQEPQEDGYPMAYNDLAEQKINLACKQVKMANAKTQCYMCTLPQ